VNVLPFDANPEQVRVHRDLASRAEKAALATGAEVKTSVRIDASIDGGVLHSLVEQEGTCLVMGWEGPSKRRREALFGSVIDRCVAVSPVPVLVCRPGADEPMSRVLLLVTDEELQPAGERGLNLMLDVARRLSRQAEAPTTIITDLPKQRLLGWLDGRFSPSVVIDGVDVLGTLAREVGAGDVVLAAAPPTAGRLGRGSRRVAEAARGHTVVITIPR
jgi:hypothetical protein